MSQLALKKTAAAVAAALASQLCMGGDFSVSPVRMFLTPRDRTIAVTVANEGDEEMMVQSEFFSWQQQPDGKDELKPTDDLVLSPPMARLMPGARQVFRLLRAGPPPALEQQTYRLVVREIPGPRKSDDQRLVRMALAYSLPVFITPAGAKRDLDCKTERTAPARVAVDCANTGRAYGYVSSLALLAPGGEKLAATGTGGYILPEVRRRFEFEAAAALPDGPVRLQATLDDGSVQTFESVLK